MKIRTDFVTNSSSSSFVCQFCGREESGMDLSMSEAEMLECENGHLVCESHFDINYKEACEDVLQNDIKSSKAAMIKYPKESERYLDDIKSAENLLGKLDSMDEYELKDLAEQYEFNYNIPAKFCPLCNFSSMTAEDMKDYLLKKHETNFVFTLSEIKDKFADYNEFKNYIRGE